MIQRYAFPGFAAPVPRGFMGRAGAYVPVTGDVLRLQILASKAADDSGGTPNVNGFVAAVRFKGMGRRHPINDPLFNASSLAIVVRDPGFDANGNPVTVTRTVRGTLPLLNTFPRTWASIGSGGTVPPRSWCSAGSGNANIYYTEAGGTRGATAPSHTTAGQEVSDGGVIWRSMLPTTIAGYQEAAAGDDMDVFAALDQPIFANSEIVSASIGAGAYQVGILSSRAAALIPVRVNSSTLGYECPTVHPLTPPHLRSTGTLAMEWITGHPWGVACVRAQAWNAARTVGSPVVTVAQSVLSNLVTTSGPGGGAVECHRATLDTSGIPRGDGFVEVEVYPALGNRVYRSRFDGDGAEWQPNTNYNQARMVARNGANLYALATPGTSAASGGPTGTGTGIADGSCVWNFLGSDLVKVISGNPQARQHFVNDPANEFTKGFCFIDPAGTATGTTGVFDSFAAANAAKGNLANCYPTPLAAATALRTFHNTAAPGKVVHDDPGGGEAYLKAGTYSGFGGTMQSLPIGAEWFYLRRDPAVPVADVIYSYNATAANRACHRRMMFSGFTHTWSTGTAIDPSSDGTAAQALPVTELWLEGFVFNGGSIANSLASRVGVAWARNGTVNDGVFNSGSTRAHWADVGGCLLNGAVGIYTRAAFGNRGVGANLIRNVTNGLANIPPMQFQVLADNFFTGSAARSGITIVEWALPTLQGAPLAVWIVGNIVESLGAEPAMRIGADATTDPCSNVTIAFNTCAGERFNLGYNDQTATPLRSGWYEFGNVTETRNTVSSYFAHAGSAKGVGRFQNLWVVYSVGSRNNVSHEGSGSGGGTFNQDTSAPMRTGINSSWGGAPNDAAQILQFVNDRSRNRLSTSGNVGDGDYRPAAGSLALNRNIAAIPGFPLRRFDRSSAARFLDGTGAVGALERAA